MSLLNRTFLLALGGWALFRNVLLAAVCLNRDSLVSFHCDLRMKLTWLICLGIIVAVAILLFRPPSNRPWKATLMIGLVSLIFETGLMLTLPKS